MYRRKPRVQGREETSFELSKPLRPVRIGFITERSYRLEHVQSEQNCPRSFIRAGESVPKRAGDERRRRKRGGEGRSPVILEYYKLKIFHRVLQPSLQTVQPVKGSDTILRIVRRNWQLLINRVRPKCTGDSCTGDDTF